MQKLSFSIASLSSFEDDFRNIQDRMKIYNSYTQNKDKINSNLEAVVSYKPDGVTFQNVSVGLDNVKLSAVSFSEIEIEQYYLNLKSSDKFENIKIQNVTINETNSSLNFTLTADVKIQI